ncbi:hypothetical protein EYC84_000564 [Monilinia fructicola]|uniref:Uncharacterized protein n=1 Tax=Monilinia fructicola TaxID=38448 RepID=A0A5M9JPP6_MONFR|nr:hypothetical protein EYC84_000564 [Monilinia fructicola]
MQMPFCATIRDLGFEHQATKDARDRRILTGEEVLLSLESVEDLRGAGPSYASTRAPIDEAVFHPTPTAGIVGGFDLFSVLPETTGDPIPKSILLEYFINQLAPWLSSYDDAQISGRPAFSWLPFALHHPPLLYATLLSAAVHLDRKQPMDKRTLVWYKFETIRLANETMNIPIQATADEMLLVGGGNAEEYEMHLSGINQMLTIRGGMGSLGMRGMIKNWLGICYGPWNNDWHYGIFADFYGIKRKSQT